MDDLRVKDVFPIQGGIMSAISQAGGYDFNPDMDLLLLSKCGKRAITPVVELLLDGSDRLTQAQIDRLASLIIFEYGEAWRRIQEALQLEYNPLSASQYHEEETTDTAGESSDTDNITQKKDVSTVDSPPIPGPGTYIPDGQEQTETQSAGTNRTNVTRTLNRTSNGTSFKSADLLQSEIAMRINSRFTAQVLEDVKNYIAMMIY